MKRTESSPTRSNPRDSPRASRTSKSNTPLGPERRDGTFLVVEWFVPNLRNGKYYPILNGKHFRNYNVIHFVEKRKLMEGIMLGHRPSYNFRFCEIWLEDRCKVGQVILCEKSPPRVDFGRIQTGIFSWVFQNFTNALGRITLQFASVYWNGVCKKSKC